MLRPYNDASRPIGVTLQAISLLPSGEYDERSSRFWAGNTLGEVP